MIESRTTTSEVYTDDQSGQTLDTTSYIKWDELNLELETIYEKLVDFVFSDYIENRNVVYTKIDENFNAINTAVSESISYIPDSNKVESLIEEAHRNTKDYFDNSIKFTNEKLDLINDNTKNSEDRISKNIDKISGKIDTLGNQFNDMINKNDIVLKRWTIFKTISVAVIGGIVLKLLELLFYFII